MHALLDAYVSNGIDRLNVYRKIISIVLISALEKSICRQNYLTVCLRLDFVQKSGHYKGCYLNTSKWIKDNRNPESNCHFLFQFIRSLA